MDNLTKPRFKVGDVVCHICESIPGGPQYFIRDVIYPENANNSSEYCYDASQIDAPDETKRFYESMLEFQYHDSNWEEYVTESAFRNNGLPAWRGDIYNAAMFYVHPDKSEAVDNNKIKKYMLHNADVTLPPTQMLHILESHSIFRRISTVYTTKGNIHTKKAI